MGTEPEEPLTLQGRDAILLGSDIPGSDEPNGQRRTSSWKMVPAVDDVRFEQAEDTERPRPRYASRTLPSSRGMHETYRPPEPFQVGAAIAVGQNQARSSAWDFG